MPGAYSGIDSHSHAARMPWPARAAPGGFHHPGQGFPVREGQAQMLGLALNMPSRGSVHRHQKGDANPGPREQKAAAPLPPELPAQRERTPQGSGEPAMKLSLTREAKDVSSSMKSQVTTITGSSRHARGSRNCAASTREAQPRL